jgi:hypothetical protein
MQQFNKRWNIVVDEQQEFEQFRNRILAAVDHSVGKYLLYMSSISRRYAFILGQRQPPQSMTSSYIDLLDSVKGGRSLKDNNIYRCIANASDFPGLITYIQTLFWVLEESICPIMSKFARAIQQAVDYSPAINLRIAQRGKQITLYRAGAKLLDEKAVDETLSWLTDYPKIAKYFEEALHIYLSGDEKKYRNLLDNLRLALEQVVRIVLKNKKSLENQEPLLVRWLDEHGVHQQVTNMYRDLLIRFAQYQNDAVKHGEGWSLAEVEFMIYLTGIFIRLLLQLNK